MTIKSAGTYMQISDLCKSCSKQSFCGNGMTDYYCTGYAPCVETRCDIKVPPFTDGQKKLIEMTEKLAEKRGGKICDVDDDITDIKELLNDTIKQIEEPTNYDWLRSLNTEQLAEWLKDTLARCYRCGGCDELAERNCTVKICYYADVTEWLKQPHNENE